MLVPLTRGHDGVALQFEAELTALDQLDQLRHRGSARRGDRGLDARLQRDPARRLVSRSCGSTKRPVKPAHLAFARPRG